MPAQQAGSADEAVHDVRLRARPAGGDPGDDALVRPHHVHLHVPGQVGQQVAEAVLGAAAPQRVGVGDEPHPASTALAAGDPSSGSGCAASATRSCATPPNWKPSWVA